MKISVIVPTNNIENINGFIESFNSMKHFSKKCEIIINPNGNINTKDIIRADNVVCLNQNYKLENFENKIVPFVKLRGFPMAYTYVNGGTDWFLFLDDDNRFPEGSDEFYIQCYNFLDFDPTCSVLELSNKGNSGIYEKTDGFFWTGYGLFLRHTELIITDIMKDIIYLKGACEDILYSYLTLEYSGLPYVIYGNPTTRDKSKPNDWNQNNNPSYSEEVLNNNVIGYIRKKFNEPNWEFYKNINCLRLPKLLQEKINNRMNNEYR